MDHELKTHTKYFHDIWCGNKRFELRRNDRNYRSNDRLILKEYNPDTKVFTGRQINADVVYILYGGEFSLPKNMCIMQIQIVSMTGKEYSEKEHAEFYQR